MIFFEGFGSLFPYFIYLSLIWICLIFGFRGQIVEILHLTGSKNQAISPTTLNSNDNKIFHYYDFTKTVHRNEKTNISLTTSNNFNLVFEDNCNYYKIKNLPVCLCTGFFYSFHRRGPPSLFS
jgi:hypothetical protein